MADRLKLQAEDSEDLRIIAACLQDALAPAREMAYLPKERRFVMLLNRFCWECADSPARKPPVGEGGLPDDAEDAAFAEEAGGPPFERVHCALRIERVRAVRSRGVRRPAGDELLELLTISSEPQAIELVFAGGAAVRVEVDAIRCYLEDLGEPWPTRWRPRHPAEGEDTAAP
jgi:hypothetical protein